MRCLKTPSSCNWKNQKLIAIAAVIFAELSLSSTATATPTCPPPPDVDCMPVRSWSDLRSKLQSADNGEDIVLCPFHIFRGLDDSKIVIRTSVHVFCGTKVLESSDGDDSDCIIDGPGSHVRIFGAWTEAVLQGLTFTGATDSALVVLPTATGLTRICGCTFTGNVRKNNGAAMRVGTNTNVVIESCAFRDNTAAKGGAIYNRGNLRVFDSTFERNSARYNFGGSIGNSDEGFIEVESSTFLDNGIGPAVAVELDGNSWIDGGGNVVNAIAGCEGIHDSTGCNEFFISWTPTFSPHPSAAPTSSLIPTLSFRPSELPSQSPTNSPTAVPTQTLTLSPTCSHQPTTWKPLPVTFYAIGDVPYDALDNKERLPNQLMELPADVDGASFIIHVGDIKPGRGDFSNCTREAYNEVADILRVSPVPVFIIPGDNEYNDCTDPDDAWTNWMAVFGDFTTRYWPSHGLNISRQLGREENFAFFVEESATLFIGLNLVGGRIHNGTEWETRLSEQFFWTRDQIQDHLDIGVKAVTIFGHSLQYNKQLHFFEPLKSYLTTDLDNSLPVLYLQGDAHKWSYTPNALDVSSLLQVVLSGGTDEPALKVTVYSGSLGGPTEVFAFDRRLPDAFIPGNLSNIDEATGLRLSVGLSARIIAKAGEHVSFTSQYAMASQSSDVFHGQPDGAAIFTSDEGGWIYVSNSEMKDGVGGVYALYFDQYGNAMDYTALLKNTTRNCSGGRTPWNTYVSCEEHSSGLCWQVDPKGARTPGPTNLVESEGGNFESVACDNRDSSKPIFFVTEDHKHGAIRRYQPNPLHVSDGWDMLHADGGTLDYLEFMPNNEFRWTKSLDAGRESAYKHYINVEGIDQRNGLLFFVSKKLRRLFTLSLDEGTYTSEPTDGGLFGDGSFSNTPDQLVLIAGGGSYIFLTEDGGMTPGVYVRETSTGNYLAIFEGLHPKFWGDETTGLAFSPDRKRMYACMQDVGYLFEFVRDDGKPFDGEEMHLKYHSAGVHIRR